jgi:hypothetical protein
LRPIFWVLKKIFEGINRTNSGYVL